VGDECHRRLGGLPDSQQLVLQKFARLRVQRSEGLVHQQNLGLVGEAAGDRHPLLHPAAELVRVAVGEAGQSDQFERVGGAGFARSTAQSCALEGKFDVGPRRPPREKRVLLEDHRAVQAGPGHRAPVDEHLTRGRCVQPGEQIEQGGLAGTAWPDQGDELTMGDVEGDVLQSGEVLALLIVSGGPQRELFRDVLQRDGGAHEPAPTA
jgi:hypothetical protein